MLTEKQRELLSFITAYQTKNLGVSPTFNEMASAMDLKSKSGVGVILDKLCERGFIRRLKHRPRAIEIIRDNQ